MSTDRERVRREPGGTKVRIAASDLWTHGEPPEERAPLSDLEADGELGHIHGLLTIELAGRAVPHLGFFGPDDVCLDTWVVELCNAVNRLAIAPSEYTFDEGEQGQPAFRFVRVGDELAVSIVESSFSGGRADPDWQAVTCRYADFRAALVDFLGALRDDLRLATLPGIAERWWPPEAVVAEAS